MIEEKNGVTAYIGIPYAKNAGRFQPAEPITYYSGEAESSGKGHIFKQLPGRLAASTGVLTLGYEQTEDAFELSIWTRGNTGKKPVMFWIHGGAFLSGGGVLPSCDGSAWVEKEDIVFVAINYRLGVLGALYAPELMEENLGLRDILLAFDWVRRNIAQFGGDPDNISVGGQSAGAWYTLAMLGMPERKGQIRRAMVFSCPGTCKPLPPEGSKPMTEAFFDSLGLYGKRRAEALDSEKVSADRILDATKAASKKSPQFGVGIMPTLDGELLCTEDIIAKAAEVSGGTVDIICSATAEETSGFVKKFRPAFSLLLSDAFFAPIVKKLHSAPPAEVLRFHREKMKKLGRSGRYSEIIQLTTDTCFRAPTFRIAEAMSAAGSRVYMASCEFEHAPEGFGACHCFDLPLIFDNIGKFPNAPMLEVPPEVMAELGQLAEKYNAALSRFVRGGQPDVGEVAWQPFTAESRRVMRIASQCELVQSTEEFAPD